MLIELKPSKQLAFFIAFLCILSSVSIHYLLLPYWLCITLITLNILVAGHSIARYALLITPKSVTRIQIRWNDNCLLIYRNGHWGIAKLQAPPQRIGKLFSVNYQYINSNKVLRLLVFPDMLGPENWSFLSRQAFSQSIAILNSSC